MMVVDTFSTITNKGAALVLSISSEGCEGAIPVITGNGLVWVQEQRATIKELAIEDIMAQPFF